MRKLLLSLVTATLLLLPAALVSAGNPHFVGTPVATISGTTLTVVGREAGLGDEAQIHVTVTATAECINPGNNHPQAANKETVSAAGDFPVQNGHADFTLSVTAVFQPSCSPPMSVVFSGIVVADTTNGLSVSL